MKRGFIKGLLMMFVFVIALAFSGNCYAAVSFQADGGKDFVLDFNQKNSYGRYILLEANGSTVFTFDYDDNTQEFTMYNDNGSIYAIRKMLSWDRMLHREKPGGDSIVFVRRGDGYYYRENYSSPRTYEHTPKAFNTFLENKSMFMGGQSNAGQATRRGQVSFQADGGKNFMVAYNHKNEFGEYILLDMDANGYVEFTFDYDRNTKKFTMYRDRGGIYAIRQMLSWDKLLHWDNPNSEPVLYIRGADGDYYQKNGNGIYEHTPKAFNIILERNGDL